MQGIINPVSNITEGEYKVYPWLSLGYYDFPEEDTENKL